jgi:ParB family transcriptional regulator, chromosome partitioning protein
VLRLSALHPDALIYLAHDKIGMEAAQALTLTDDHDRQLEALKRFGNSTHQIRFRKECGFDSHRPHHPSESVVVL